MALKSPNFWLSDKSRVAGHWVWPAPKLVDYDVLTLYIIDNLPSIITGILEGNVTEISIAFSGVYSLFTIILLSSITRKCPKHMQILLH